MPIYEYICDDCGENYERIVMNDRTAVTCPKCESAKHTIKLSVFAAPGNEANPPLNLPQPLRVVAARLRLRLPLVVGQSEELGMAISRQQARDDTRQTRARTVQRNNLRGHLRHLPQLHPDRSHELRAKLPRARDLPPSLRLIAVKLECAILLRSRLELSLRVNRELGN